MTIPNWQHNRALAIDVAITCPFTKNNMSKDSPCEAYAENAKHKKYDADFKGTD